MAEETRQLPLRRAESAATFVLVVQLVAGVVALLLSRLTGSPAARAEAWHLMAGVLVWFACLVHQRLRRRAEEEALEAESLKEAQEKGQVGSSLFEGEGAELTSARDRLEQFEKYFLPGFSILILAALGSASFYLLRKLAAAAPVSLEGMLASSWIFVGVAFVSFLLAKYTAGLATQAPWRPLRPGANYSMSCALGSLLVAIALVFHHFELPIVEQVVSYVIPIVLAVMAGEILLLFIMSIYRPRVAGQEVRAAHDSRVLGMLTTSRGVLRTTAETLDYQFGFKVSETWFYRFMERAIAPLILFQLLALYLLSCFVMVDTGEQAVIEFFGRPRQRGNPLGPGLHLKWPWPIEIAYRHPVRRVDLLSIGEELKEDVPGFLWTESHAHEAFNLLVATREEGAAEPGAPEGARKDEVVPVSMVSGTIYVYYAVNSLRDYLYRYSDPRGALSALCYRELARYAASADFLQLLGTQRADAAKTLHERFQRRANEMKLGVEIVDVNLQGIHPPVEVGEAFEDVVGAMEDKQAEIHRGEAYYNAIVPEAKAQAERVRLEAEAKSLWRKRVEPARAERFLARLKLFKKAPGVYRCRELIRAMVEALARSQKIIVPRWVDTDEVIIIDLSEKILPAFGLESEIEEGTGP